MSRVCPRPCPFVQRHRYNLIRLRDHLAEGHRCADAWIALAHLVREPWQRLDCLERAFAIDPDDQNCVLLTWSTMSCCTRRTR